MMYRGNRIQSLAFSALIMVQAIPLVACDLCAIYRATNARGESSSGFLCTLSQQFIHYGTLQKEGEPYDKPPFNDAYLDTSITHFVPAYNFSEQFGVSLNIPMIYRNFRRVQLDPYPRGGVFPTTFFDDESG